MPDAVVIGAGPNGLVAANLLADAGWTVEVLEAEDTPGGAVRHDRGVDPAYVSDVFSAFYPLAAASPVLAGLRLHEHGLRWSHAPSVLAHPLRDGRCAVLSRNIQETARSLDTFAAGDGDSWREQFEVWRKLRSPLLDALFTPFPPVRAGARLAAAVRAGAVCGWPGRCCCRCGGWVRNCSAERAGACCSRATPCTRIWHRRRRSAVVSAG